MVVLIEPHTAVEPDGGCDWFQVGGVQLVTLLKTFLAWYDSRIC